MTSQPPDNGPFATREQAEAVFAGFAQAAERGTSGPPGEQIVTTTHQYLADALTDTVEYWAPLGGEDRQVISQLAGLLDPVDIRVICSWFHRVMNDNPSTRKDTDH